MATTSPDNIRTPNPTDNFNLVADWATTASDVQDALTRRANAYKGTASQRGSLTSTAADGTLWQDTDGVKMIWRKDGSVWVPAVWRWSGTTAQMNAFAAPDGFEWHNTTTGLVYRRSAGSWVGGIYTVSITGSGWVTQSPVSAIVGDGFVSFQGIISHSSFTGGFTTVATLPSGVPRPAQDSTFDLTANSNIGVTLRVQPGGAMQIYREANTGAWTHLGGVVYRIPPA